MRMEISLPDMGVQLVSGSITFAFKRKPTPSLCLVSTHCIRACGLRQLSPESLTIQPLVVPQCAHVSIELMGEFTLPNWYNVRTVEVPTKVPQLDC